MSENFIPKLTTSDWNEEWKALQMARQHADRASYWNERSKTYTTKDTPNIYVENFLKLAGVGKDESVFDMGCGTGGLCLPLAERGHQVIAADFSQGMLSIMKSRLIKQHITTVIVKQMAWADDWAQFGVTANKVDVAFASRSIATSDLKDALLRLSAVARRRICITLPTGSSPRLDEGMLQAVGLPNRRGHDYLYAFNILINEGFLPEVNYIATERDETFDTYEEAYKLYAHMIDRVYEHTTSAQSHTQARKKLHAWLEANLQINKNAGNPDKKGVVEKKLTVPKSRQITWAFLAWNK